MVNFFNWDNLVAHCAKLYNSRFAHIVKHGDSYAVRRRYLLRIEYLDLNSILPATTIEGGVIYSKENNYGRQPQRVYWWDNSRNIIKYCLNEDIEYVINAHAALCGYEPEPEPELPPLEVIEDIAVERAVYKMRS